MEEENITEAYTFDDLLLLPQYSEVIPSAVQTNTFFCRGISLAIPIVSAAMDTVTESEMAIAMAIQGGIGIIHRNMTADAQATQVRKVKRHESAIIYSPLTLTPDDTITKAKQVMTEHSISGIPIVQKGVLVGIVTRRDLAYVENGKGTISEIMVRKVITASPDITMEKAVKLMKQHRIEKLPIVGKKNVLVGLITLKDVRKLQENPRATKDSQGRLRVAAAVGVHDYERASKLAAAGVDAVCVDSAHGHSKNVIETVKKLKKELKIPVIAGNVATFEGAKALVDAGADGVKVGIGPGSICTTRIVTGVGVPQLTAIMNAAKACVGAEIPVIADGGIRYSGDITKALAMGASSVMLGNLLAGTDESPGEKFTRGGRTFKSYRGMGSLGAMSGHSQDRYSGAKTAKTVPEGIEGVVPYKGKTEEIVSTLVGGLKSGMGYVGASSINELHKKARFVKITKAGLLESHPHDIEMTKEAPNYSPGTK